MVIKTENKFVKKRKYLKILYFHKIVDDGILQQQYGIEQTSRYIYMKQIFDFIKYTDLEFDFNEHDL